MPSEQLVQIGSQIEVSASTPGRIGHHTHHLGGRHGAGEQVALAAMAAHALQHREHLGFLDSLGYAHHAEILDDVDGRKCEREHMRIARNVGDEGLVDLDAVEG